MWQFAPGTMNSLKNEIRRGKDTIQNHDFCQVKGQQVNGTKVYKFIELAVNLWMASPS